MKKSFAYFSIFILLAFTAGATTPWGPKQAEFNQKFTSIQPRISAWFLLGLHGELFWSVDFSADFLRNARCFAVKKEDGSGIELLAERNLEFILYASVTPDGVITYAETPEAKKLTDKGFCGIRRWPDKELLAGPPKRGEVKTFAEIGNSVLPKGPNGCEAVAYALSDGAFFFCQPNDIYSPYPLWLMRVNDEHMRLVPTDGSEMKLVDIGGIEDAYSITIYRDAWMKEIRPARRGFFDLKTKFTRVPAPTRIIYISELWINSGETGPIRESHEEDSHPAE